MLQPMLAQVNKVNRSHKFLQITHSNDQIRTKYDVSSEEQDSLITKPLVIDLVLIPAGTQQSKKATI